MKNNSKKYKVSQENDKFTGVDNEIMSNTPNQDSFKFLGDTTNYEFDFYGGETALKNRGIKFIRNEDYLVVYDKEYVKESNGNSVSSIIIDDKIVDEILDDMEKKNTNKTCLKLNFSKNENGSNSSQNSSNTENNGSSESTNETSKNTVTNLFEKEVFDLWTVDKITNNLGKADSINDEFTFKKPEQNKIFTNLNRPFTSFLQLNENSEPKTKPNPFFVITDDMIKNSQDVPIMLDENTLQSLINNQNSNITVTKKTIIPVQQEELLEESRITNSNPKIMEENIILNEKPPTTSFVQTKLQGITRERLSDLSSDSNIYTQSSDSFNHVSYDGYYPNEESLVTKETTVSGETSNENKLNTGYDAAQNSNKFSNSKEEKKENTDDDYSLEGKTPEEIMKIKKKMEKLLKMLNSKLDDSEKNSESNSNSLDDDSNFKKKVNENVDKAQKIVEKFETSSDDRSEKSSKTEEIKEDIHENLDKVQKIVKNLKDTSENTNSIKEQKDNDDLKTILDGPNDDDEVSSRKLKKIVEKTEKETNFPGQGKVAVDKNGKWDEIPIFNISNWPDKCKYGSYQSPIHIGLSETFFVEPNLVTLDYGKPSNNEVEIYNDGYKLAIQGMFGTIKYGEHVLPTTEIYIHHPSEHTFGDDQARTDFEIQILHENNGARVMVAVFLHDMGENKKNE